MSAIACEIDPPKMHEPVSTAVVKDSTATDSLSSPSSPLIRGGRSGDDNESDESSIYSQSSQEYVSSESTHISLDKANIKIAHADNTQQQHNIQTDADTSSNNGSSDEEEELQTFTPQQEDIHHHDDTLSDEREPAGQDSSGDSSSLDSDASTTQASSSPATSVEKDEEEYKFTSQDYMNSENENDAKDVPRSLRMSHVSVSELNEVSLDEEKDAKQQQQQQQQAPRSILKTLTDASATMLARARSDTTSATESVTIPNSSSTTANSTKPPPIVTNRASADSISSARNLFGIWSSIKNGAKRRASESSNASAATSDVANTPLIVEHRSVATDDARHVTKRLSQRRSASQPLLVHENDILAQMEQLNAANTNDPKARMLNNLKRQSLRKSLASQYRGTDDYDWDFWAGALCDFEQTAKSKKLLQHVQRGIPPSIRGMVWQLLSGSKDHVLQAQYINLLKAPSPYEKMIQRDLARTFPGHKFFKERDGVGQEGLYNVVRSYSVLDQDVGYCQGLAFIVGPLLLNMPDDEAFCVLVQLMNKYGLRGHYTPDMEGLHLRLYQFDALVEEHLPHIARHLVQQGVGSTMYASQWFMTLFAYKFPLNLVFRIYDILLTEGVVSMFKFALALLKRNQTAILSLDFEHLLNFLKNGLFEEYKDDDRRLVEDAITFEISQKRLSQLEKEHKTQMAKEVADARTVEQLQRTNADLRKRSKELEQTTLTVRREQNDIYEQLKQTRADLAHAKDEHASLMDLVQVLRQEVQALPAKIEAQCRAQFEDLCTENRTLVEKNSTLEDQLSNLETMVIDMKMRYAQSENERGELQQRLYEMKKLIGA